MHACMQRSCGAGTAAMAAPTSAFDIPAAPILIPEGPWQEVEGSVCAAKGFKAQGVLIEAKAPDGAVVACSVRGHAHADMPKELLY